MNEKKLTGKDLINIGIYAAIYFVIVFAVAMKEYVEEIEVFIRRQRNVLG